MPPLGRDSLVTRDCLRSLRIDIWAFCIEIPKAEANCSHVIFPDWVERQEQLFRLNIKAFEDISKFMKELSTPKTLRKDDSGMVV